MKVESGKIVRKQWRVDWSSYGNLHSVWYAYQKDAENFIWDLREDKAGLGYAIPEHQITLNHVK